MEGKTVYDFSLGEPDFNTPAHICEAAYKAMLAGHTHYTAASGMPELRGAIARWYKRTYGFEFTPEQVVVSNGAKHSLHNALAASVGPGDEVIIPTPYWVSYSDLVQMTGALIRVSTYYHGERLQDDACPAQGGHHAEDSAGDAQFAEQSDRQRLHPGRVGGARRRRRRQQSRRHQR